MMVLEFLAYGIIVGAILFGIVLLTTVLSGKPDPKGDPTPPEFRPTPYQGMAVPVSHPSEDQQFELPPEDRRRDEDLDDWSDYGIWDGR